MSPGFRETGGGAGSDRKEPPGASRRGLVLFAANAAWNIRNFRLPLMAFLGDHGFRVEAAAPPDTSEVLIAPEGFPFHPLPMTRKGTNPLADFLLLFRFFRLYRRIAPSVVCHFTVKPVIYGTLAVKLLRIFFPRRFSRTMVVNNISGLGTVFITRSAVTRIVELLYRLSLGASSRVFFQNRDDLELFVSRRLVPENLCALLPGSGIDLERFSPREGENRGPGRPCPGNLCPGNPRRFRFLLIARLLRDKGIAEYAEAASIIRARWESGLPNQRNSGLAAPAGPYSPAEPAALACPPPEFFLLGPQDRDNRTAIAEDELARWTGSGNLCYLGVREDVRDAIGSADCVVLPSYREGTPRTLLEAAAMGKPVAASDVPGCREVLRHGVTGYLFPPRNAAALADTLETIARLPGNTLSDMGRAGRALMEERFDQRIVFSRYAEALGCGEDQSK